jgi:hypothetical protein
MARTPGEFAEAGRGITAQYGPAGLGRVGGDDQVVCAARGTGSAGMGEQAPVVSRGRLRVVKDIDGGCYRHECPGAFGCPVGRIRHLDAGAVLGGRYRTCRCRSVRPRRAVCGRDWSVRPLSLIQVLAKATRSGSQEGS